MCEILVKKGGDQIEIADNDGNTPLMWAIKMNNIGCIKILCESLCDNQQQKSDNYWPTLLMFAVKNGEIGGIKILWEYAKKKDIKKVFDCLNSDNSYNEGKKYHSIKFAFAQKLEKLKESEKLENQNIDQCREQDKEPKEELRKNSEKEPE